MANDSKSDLAPLSIPPIVAVNENGEPERDPSGWNRRNWFIEEYLRKHDEEEKKG